jgi:hypothetical protein
MGIEQIRELMDMFDRANTAQSESPFIGQHVVLRTENAGVHIGRLNSLSGGEAVVSGARRLWCWRGAFSLSEVATKGVDSVGTRMAVEIPFMQVNGVIEVIPTTEAARTTFAECGE